MALFSESTVHSGVVIITDPCSADPDDILSLLMLVKLSSLPIKGIIATHHFPRTRAKIVKLLLTELGLSDIPVYISDYNQTYDDFACDNPLFPKIFGTPDYDGNCTTQKWFPNFGRAFTEVYGQDVLDDQKINTGATNFLLEELKQCDDNKLLVICLAPPHDLKDIPLELYRNMDLWCMGGGFETNVNSVVDGTTKKLELQSLGYNWGICPNIVDAVLKNLELSDTAMTLISSKIVREKQVHVPLELYNKWLEKEKPSTLTKTIMLDWLYCNRGNQLTEHKNMCDPLTLMLAFYNNRYNVKSVDLMAHINSDRVADYKDGPKGYLMVNKDNPLLEMERMNCANVHLIYDFDSQVIQDILDILNRVLMQ